MSAPQAYESTADIGHFVDGKVVHPKEGRFADVYNPTKGVIARRVALASRKEVDDVVTVAEAAFQSWGQTSPLRRARIMFKYLELLNANRDELAAIITAEHGKVLPMPKGKSPAGLILWNLLLGSLSSLKETTPNRFPPISITG